MQYIRIYLKLEHHFLGKFKHRKNIMVSFIDLVNLLLKLSFIKNFTI